MMPVGQLIAPTGIIERGGSHKINKRNSGNGSNRKGIWIPCIILAVVWTAHMIYFLFFVKTIKQEVVAEGE